MYYVKDNTDYVWYKHSDLSRCEQFIAEGSGPNGVELHIEFLHYWKGNEMSWLEVVPAYGRDYKNQKTVKEDWNANKDFKDPWTGSYINKADADKMPELNVNVRYDNSRKVVTVKWVWIMTTGQ